MLDQLAIWRNYVYVHWQICRTLAHHPEFLHIYKLFWPTFWLIRVDFSRRSSKRFNFLTIFTKKWTEHSKKIGVSTQYNYNYKITFAAQIIVLSEILSQEL